MINPIYNNLLIETIENETITKQGLIIKSNQNDEIKIGKIIKISKNIINEDFKENLKVLFNISEASKVYFNNKNFILIDANKILGIIEGEEYE